MSLELGIRRIHDVRVVYVRGRVTFGDGASELREALRAMVREGCRKILLDMGEVCYVDSSGLGVLVSECARMRNQRGQIKLLNLTNRVVDLLLTTRLFPVFEVFDDEAAALRSFGEAAAAI
jgi:anti-sigma B factor antagonist